MAPAFAQFEQKYKNRIKIVEVNVDDRALLQKYAPLKGSQYIPETVVLRNDAVVVQQTGVMSEQQLEEAVQKAL